jgi:5'(3')-deoxyribonucleotidase
MKMSNDETKQIQYVIFCDLDGVLADFTGGVTKAMREINPALHVDTAKWDTDRKYRDSMWKAMTAYQQKYGYVLWRNMETLPDAYQLWDYIKPYNPQILSATGNASYRAMEQKRGWVTEHFGSSVRVNTTESAREKAQYAGPNHILIDDKMKAIQPWLDAGGIGILHTSAASTIQQLKQLGL